MGEGNKRRAISIALFIIGVVLMIAGPVILYAGSGEPVDNAAISVAVSVYGLSIALFSSLWNTMGDMKEMLRDNSYMLKTGIETLKEIGDILRG